MFLQTSATDKLRNMIKLMNKCAISEQHEVVASSIKKEVEPTICIPVLLSRQRCSSGVNFLKTSFQGKLSTTGLVQCRTAQDTDTPLIITLTGTDLLCISRLTRSRWIHRRKCYPFAGREENLVWCDWREVLFPCVFGIKQRSSKGIMDVSLICYYGSG